MSSVVKAHHYPRQLFVSVLAAGLAAPALALDGAPAFRGWSFRALTANDNLVPTSVVPRAQREPLEPERYADDDGATGGLALRFQRRINAKQTWNLRFDADIFTAERQRFAPRDPRRNDRNDVATVTASVSELLALGSGASLTTTSGVGVQATGPLGGYDVQVGIHRHLPLGGRIKGLQDNYTQKDVTYAPVIYQEVAVSYPIKKWIGVRLDVTVTSQMLLALGSHGVSTAEAAAGLRLTAGRAMLGADVVAAGMRPNDRNFDFLDGDRWHTGYRVTAALPVVRVAGVALDAVGSITRRGTTSGDTVGFIGFQLSH